MSESESIKMSDDSDSDSDFGFGSSSPLLDDDEPSTTTQESVVDDGHRQQQQQQDDVEAVIVREEDKDNKKQKEKDDVQASNKEKDQDNKHSTTTQELVVDDEHEVVIIGDDGKDNKEHDIQVANEEQHEQTEQDNIESVDDDEQEQDDIEVENKEDFEAHKEDEGYSGGTKKRRWFTLQEKLMYLWVICRKVDKGLSLWEASKLINISHKQILDWKKQVGKMKNKNNQHAKSLGDGVTSFLSPYTENLLSFIFKMRETGMAVSVNSIVLKALQLSREFTEKTYTARPSAMRRFINVHGFMHQMGTHLFQHQLSEMEEIATDFVCVTCEKLQMSCRVEAYITNMDQTPVPFSYDPKKT